MKIFGLTENPEFNGDLATVKGFDDKFGVYKVKLDRNLKTIGLAEQNLEIITEGAAAAAHAIADAKEKGYSLKGVLLEEKAGEALNVTENDREKFADGTNVVVLSIEGAPELAG